MALISILLKGNTNLHPVLHTSICSAKPKTLVCALIKHRPDWPREIALLWLDCQLLFSPSSGVIIFFLRSRVCYWFHAVQIYVWVLFCSHYGKSPSPRVNTVIWLKRMITQQASGEAPYPFVGKLHLSVGTPGCVPVMSSVMVLTFSSGENPCW